MRCLTSLCRVSLVLSATLIATAVHADEFVLKYDQGPSVDPSVLTIHPITLGADCPINPFGEICLENAPYFGGDSAETIRNKVHAEFQNAGSGFPDCPGEGFTSELLSESRQRITGPGSFDLCVFDGNTGTGDPDVITKVTGPGLSRSTTTTASRCTSRPRPIRFRRSLPLRWDWSVRSSRRWDSAHFDLIGATRREERAQGRT